MENKKVGGNVASVIGNSPGLQSVHYAYNIRGWLKQINDPTTLGTDLFAFKINYNTIEMGASAVPLYNGNISETIWRTANTEANGNRKRGYAYQYDALNRLKVGQFRRANSAGSSFNEQANDYNVTGIAYDKNGNIMALDRRGVVNSSNGIGDMDKLIYDYGVGNKLMDVTDSGSTSYGFVGSHPANDYDYDANGNMVSDANKGITGIVYNHLNLPTGISINGSGGNGTISYIYDATGNKLEKKVTEGSTTTRTFYAGNYVYEKVNTNADVLKFFSHPEGYVDAENGFGYVYQYKDHLGNVRLSYSDLDLNGAIDSSSEVIEESNYYPFGLQHKGYNNVVNGTENNYQTFQGQEDEKELGKNTYAFQWRDYDPAIGRFNKIDRFAEKYYEDTPYHFSKNSPIYFREIAGDSVRVAQVAIYDNVNNTNYQQQLTNDWQQQTGLTLNVDNNTGLISYATDANGNAIVSTTTDANGNIAQNGSASARADLIGYIDGNGVTDIGVTPNDSGAPNGGNQIWLGDSQITSFINGTPAELNDRTLGVGMTAFHEFRHTAAGGSNSDPTTPGDTSTGPVVNRVNVYRQELDNNPSNTGARPYGQRSRYQATPSGNSSSIRFRYQTTNGKGRTVRRSTNITF